MYAYSNGLFYPLSMQDDYEATDSWPNTFVVVNEEVFSEYSGTPPLGKMRGTNADGLPTWKDVPPPTSEEVAGIVVNHKNALLAEATAMIAPLRDAMDGGYLDDSDKPRLLTWQRYRYELTKVDINNPEWPKKPSV